MMIDTMSISIATNRLARKFYELDLIDRDKVEETVYNMLVRDKDNIQASLSYARVIACIEGLSLLKYSMYTNDYTDRMKYLSDAEDLFKASEIYNHSFLEGFVSLFKMDLDDTNYINPPSESVIKSFNQIRDIVKHVYFREM